MNIEKIKSAISPVLAKNGATEAYIFGSVVRDEDEPESDVDILVKFEKLGGLFEFVHVKLELQDALGGRKVDLVEIDALRPEYKKYIDKDKIRILWGMFHLT